VYAVKSQIKGKLLDVYQGKVGVHDMGSNMPGYSEGDPGADGHAQPDWLDKMMGYLDAQSGASTSRASRAGTNASGTRAVYAASFKYAF